MLIGIDAHNLEVKRTGVGRYLFNLLKIWSSTQTYHTPEHGKDGQVKFILYFKDKIPNDIPKADFFELKLLKTRSTAKFMNWDLARAAAKDKVDVLFCPDYRAPIFYSGRTAITLHDISYEARPEWFNWPSPADRILLKWASKKTAQKAKLIFVPVEFVKAEVVEHYQVLAERIVITPEAVDPALLELPPNLEEAMAEVKAKYGLKDNFGFYVGSIFSRRHLPEITKAFYRVAKENYDWQMLISGWDYTPGRSVDKAVKRLNKDLGRQAIIRVDFIEDSELKLLYSACAFFIWLSDYEGFGLPPLEAMSLGAPVITTDGTSLREVAGRATILAKDNSCVEEIYRAMKKLVDNPGLREALGRLGREQAAKFSWQNCAAKTLVALLKL